MVDRDLPCPRSTDDPPNIQHLIICVGKSNLCRCGLQSLGASWKTFKVPHCSLHRSEDCIFNGVRDEDPCAVSCGHGFSGIAWDCSGSECGYYAVPCQSLGHVFLLFHRIQLYRPCHQVRMSLCTAWMRENVFIELPECEDETMHVCKNLVSQ